MVKSSSPLSGSRLLATRMFCEPFTSMAAWCRDVKRCQARCSIFGLGMRGSATAALRRTHPNHDAIAAALVVFRLFEVNVPAVDCDVDHAAVACNRRVFEINAFKSRVDGRSFALERRLVLGKLEPRGRIVTLAVGAGSTPWGRTSQYDAVEQVNVILEVVIHPPGRKRRRQFPGG